jgi:RimJ/RimL family protein N-acetyltransferase
MEEVRLIPAHSSDAAALAAISKRAFDSDVCCGAPGPGGPPRYDTAQGQRQIMQHTTAYYKILLGSRLIGGVIVNKRGAGHYQLERIFLDPAVHQQGYGLAAMQATFARYPNAQTWTLDTPTWNVRTRSFYQKLGFKIVRETDEFVYFEKKIADTVHIE